MNPFHVGTAGPGSERLAVGRTRPERDCSGLRAWCLQACRRHCAHTASASTDAEHHGLHTQCGCQMFTAIGVYQLPEQPETQFFQCNLSEWSMLIDANEKNGSLAALEGEAHELVPQLTSVCAPAISDCNRLISSFRAA